MQESYGVTNGEIGKISIIQLILVFRKRWKLFVITAGLLIAVSLTLAFGTAKIPFLGRILKDVFLSQGAFHVRYASEQALIQSIKNLGYPRDFQDLSPSAASGNLGNYLAALTKTSTYHDNLAAGISAESHYGLKMTKKGKTRNIIGTSLQVDFDAKTSLLSFSYEDSDPEFAKKAVETAMALLKSSYATLLDNTVEQERASLEEKIQAANRYALEIQDKLKETGKDRVTNPVTYDNAEDMDHMRLLKEYSVNMIILDTLIAENTALAIKKNAVTDILTVVEYPDVSDMPIAPARRQLALNWVIMSVLVAILAVLLAEFGTRLMANVKARM